MGVPSCGSPQVPKLLEPALTAQPGFKVIQAIIRTRNFQVLFLAFIVVLVFWILVCF